ncbi:hypothetical protein ACIRD3_23595 [Kitasatospora sp. NPDC093550]|uniref:hypothetical protein n=1 Tax=Kitasatospora sp. NPDC093550 TaxID=3364089 RepID=UPI0037FE4E92
MRANHPSQAQEPAPRGVAGARRGIARWLPRPRAVAAGWALLAQLWGLGATGAYAASTSPGEPLPEPAQPAVRRALHGAPALGGPALGPALDGPSAEPPAGQGQPAGEATGRPPGPVGELTGDSTVEGATRTVGGTLQERIRAGGLPLPGQRAAVPDAFAIASGLLDTAPDRNRPAETRASREGEPTVLPDADRSYPGTARPTVPRQRAVPEAPPALETASGTTTTPGAPPGRDPAPLAGPTVPASGGTPETLAIADTATVTAVDDGSATATAVLAPIAAGLLLTGAAMCKHRGLPRGH